MLAHECITYFWQHRPAFIVIDEQAVETQFFEAVRFYHAYQCLDAYRNPEPDLMRLCATIRADNPYSPPFFQCLDHTISDHGYATQPYALKLTDGEWANIRLLFELYAERANAQHLEASRGLGVDVYGRSVSEIQTDIRQMEDEFSHRVFQHDAVTV